MPESHRRLAAIMFTDLVGFSALTQQNEALALELVDTKRQLLNPLLDQHSGSLIKTMGDGFLVEFSSALQAVQCAMAIQSMLHSYNNSQVDARRIDLRIGIHLGDVVFRENDVFGDGVNIASRIEPLAEPGGICISEDVERQVRNKVEVGWESLGTPGMRNIKTPIKVYRAILPWQREAQPQASSPDVSFTATEPSILVQKSIAVLPFTNMSADPENEYFSDGITEDIITQLSKIHDLKVISRTSVMRYKGTDKALMAVGRELGVANVLEGSVRRAGNQVRIVAQLIETESDSHLWADTYDRELTNIFEIQSDVAEKIASTLQAYVSVEEKASIESGPTSNLEAYDLYLRGREYLHQNTNLTRNAYLAIESFERAAELDPRFALAYCGISDAYAGLGARGERQFIEAFERAREFAAKALQLNPNLAEAYAALGTVKIRLDWEWKMGEQLLRKAIDLNPNYAYAYNRFGEVCMLNKRFDEAKELYQKALSLDPQDSGHWFFYGTALVSAGDFQEAIDLHDQWLRLSVSKNSSSSLPRGLALVQQGKYERALETFKTEDEPIFSMEGLAITHALLGNREEAQGMVDQLIKEHSNSAMYQIAMGLFYLGEIDAGFEWLELGFEARDTAMPYLNIDRLAKVIHNDSRYHDLLRRMNLK